MKRAVIRLGLAALFLGLLLRPALAVPTQFGDTGLLSQPTAGTLNAGNICLGLWANCSSGPQDRTATILPAAMTLGLGTFLEAFGSYPNVLFNDDALESGRGYANLGMKARLIGDRSSRFKVSLDGQARRSVSDQADLDGLTDFLTRGIAGFKTDTFGIHANGGYAWNDRSDRLEFEDQILYGGGIEFYPMARLRLIGEFEGATERLSGGDSPREVTAGLQYFFSPHLTLNLGGGMGLSDASPDWRLLFGLSACQGIGTYQRPVPKIVEPETAKKNEEQEDGKPARVVKVKTLTPLIPKGTPQRTAPEDSPVSQYEVPVEQGGEEIVLPPEEQVSLAGIEAGTAIGPMTAPPPAAAVGPVDTGAAAPAADGNETEAAEAEPMVGVVYRKFRLFDFAFDQWQLTENGKKALARLAEALREDPDWMILRMEGHTDNVGSRDYNQKLSLKRALACIRYMVVHHGLDPELCFVRGVGESEPLDVNSTPEGRSRNRRVDLLVLVPKEKVK